MKPLERKTAMSTRVRRRNQFLEFFIRKFDMKCAYCHEPIDPKSFFEWRDDLTIRHHDNDETNNDPANIDLMHRRCHHKAAREARANQCS